MAVSVAVWVWVGGGIWRGEVRVFEARLLSPDRLALAVGSCNGDPEVTLLRETAVDVQVKVVASSTPLRGGKDCQDIVEVQLQEPLGDRILVDKHTGRSVPVSRVGSSSAQGRESSYISGSEAPLSQNARPGLYLDATKAGMILRF